MSVPVDVDRASGSEALDFGDEAFRERLVEQLNEHPLFERHTRWFDGSIMLETEGSVCWLKVYRGRVLESLDFLPVLGYTFKLIGSAQSWAELISGERKWADLIIGGARRFRDEEELLAASSSRPPDIRAEGNVLEAQRIVLATYGLSECVVAAAEGGR